MMAGTGVSVSGGAGMLRARRRDVSIKPNRRLDRKSSRGMIYENEELRLRTININAEVEQGQNDIKKLRRENEQLRKEIWSLRDEYDKLEDILKKQKSRGEGEEYEDRSEEDEASYSDYSDEEDEEAIEEEEERQVEPGVEEEEEEEREEQLENAENQKISSEKMNNGAHRLHVDFDDLSVVDEEEEPKRDKREARAGAVGDDPTGGAVERSIDASRHRDDVLPVYFSSPLESRAETATTTGSSHGYYAECPFVFPDPGDPNYPKMLPMDNATLLMSPCSRMYCGAVTPLPSLETPGLGVVSPIFGHDDLRRHPSMTRVPIHTPPIGWQNGYVAASVQPATAGAARATQRTLTRGVAVSESPGGNDGRAFQAANFFDGNAFARPTGDSSSRNGWDFGRGDSTAIPSTMTGDGECRSTECNDGKNVDEATSDAVAALPPPDRPKHFFAPLPSRLRMPRSPPSAEGSAARESPTAAASRLLETAATSSSSDKTSSTVISRNRFSVTARKGSADIYVDGAFPSSESPRERTCGDRKLFLSTENLLVDEVRNVSRQSSSNPLVKSLSCQELTTEPFPENKLDAFGGGGGGGGGVGQAPKLTKSDNTLDNASSSSRLFRSRLNVTLRMPRAIEPSSPETPEIPELPSIDYRHLFHDPFLRSFEPVCPNYANFSSPVTRPLSIRVNENGYAPSFDCANPALPRPCRPDGDHCRLRGPVDRAEDRHRLLMTADRRFGDASRNYRVTSFETPTPRTYTPLESGSLHGMLAPADQQRLYQNVPIAPKAPAAAAAAAATILAPGGVPGALASPLLARMYYDRGGMAAKVPAQTQTSTDAGGKDSESLDAENPSPGSSPTTPRLRKTARKERSASVKDRRPLSPAAQRRRERFRKQSSVTSTDAPESPLKSGRQSRKVAAGTEKNESRSSSSGQDSPKKDRTRRVSIYFNAKKRPSLSSVRLGRSVSREDSKDRYGSSRGVEGQDTTNSERERTNSVSSGETIAKGRKASTGSGSVPWCACWGNGCV